MTDYDAIAEKFAPSSDKMAGNKYYERPATIALLPSLKGLDVLDAGCGAGFYTELAHEAGAKVVGFDPSGEMIRFARERIGDRCPLLHCSTSELDGLLNGQRFDLILSCLVLHYVEDLNTEFSLLAGLLKSDGQIIVSMKHPFAHQGIIGQRGYSTTSSVELPFKAGPVSHIQRPLGAITDAIAAAGLVIERLVESYPTEELAAAKPRMYEVAMRTPFFIHFILRRRG